MNRVLLKELARTVWRTGTRFFSILAIVAVGTGFFAGLKATGADMKQTAERYFQQTALMDLHLLSTVGFTGEDAAALAARDGIKNMMPAYFADCFLRADGGQELIAHVLSLPEGETALNRPVLREGRLPRQSGECVIERGQFGEYGFAVGQTVSLFLKDGDLSGRLKRTEFTVVGIVESPQYLSFSRGNCLVGSGEIDLFMMIPTQDFADAVFTDIYLTLQATEGLSPFEAAYSETVQAYADGLSAWLQERGRVRREEWTEQALTAMGAQGDEIRALRKEAGECAARVIALAISGNTGTPEYRQARERAESLRRTLEQAAAQLGGAMPEIHWFVQTRANNPGYSGYQEDAEKVDAISRVFPVFFVLVAALVCLTTMTRMVEEERLQIGTLKMLGYERGAITAKYLGYAVLASLLGSILGLSVGFQLFPRVILATYRILYSVPDPITPFRWDYAAACTLAAVLCTGISAYAACRRALRTPPAQLMRPKPPKNGKRVLMERVGFVWRRLSFLHKVTVRNLFRYKKRGIMTVIGIAGCTALLLTGFGLRHAILSIAPRQYGEIFRYDAAAALREESAGEEALRLLTADDAVSEAMLCRIQTADAGTGGVLKSVNLSVPADPAALARYINLHTPEGQALSLSQDGAIITQKLAAALRLNAGDEITVLLADGREVRLPVDGVAENYALNFIYLSPALYEQRFGAAPAYNTAFLNLYGQGAEERALSERLIGSNLFSGVSYSAAVADSFRDTLLRLDSIVWVLIFSAGALAFIVMYNLVNINVQERLRELATIKVLGFYNREVSAYICRENNIAAFFGMLLGLGSGIFLERFVIATAEVEAVMFASDITPECFLMAAALTAVFTAIVNVFVFFRLKRIRMAEALKAVE